jgi:geranylgeranyl diphosphate synthase type 3
LTELLYSDEFLNLHRGQGLDLFWRDSLTCPTEEEYIDMVNNSEYTRANCIASSRCRAETGGLLRLAVKLMMAKSNNDV